MANTLTNLLPTIYEAVDVVSRELVGFVPAVTRNSSAERVAVNETVTFPIAPSTTTSNITPGVTAPNDGDQTIGTTTLTITKSKYAPVRWNGEEMKGVGNTGMLQVIMRDQFSQAMRALVNEVETDLGALFSSASRATGAGGTTPFGTANDLSDFANVLRILDDNGAPSSDRHLVLGSAAIANLRGKQAVLFKVNEAGTDALLRQGIIGQVESLNLHNSAQVAFTTKGTGASYTASATYAAGVTAITLSAGSGTVLAGDNVTFAADANNRYIVGTGTAAAGPIALNNPGLRVAVPAANAMTIGTGGYQNMGFHRSAIHLVTRAPAMPEGGDTADDVTEVVDPVSGIAFQIAMYRQYRQVKFEVGLAWGVSAVKSNHICVLLG